MVVTDPIADLLTRIRNAMTAKHETVTVPASKMKKGNCGHSGKRRLCQECRSRRYRRTQQHSHYAQIRSGRREGHHQSQTRVQARTSRLLRMRRSAQRNQRIGHRHHFHVQGRHDRQRSAQKQDRRRSTRLRLVIGGYYVKNW